MRKIFLSNLVITMLVLLPVALLAQDGLKIRVAGNWAKFISEPYSERSQTTDKMIDDVFTHNRDMGFEIEALIPVTERIWAGFEVSNSNLSGLAEKPLEYNLLKTQYNMLQVKYNDVTTYFDPRTVFPLEYETSILNFKANFRYYVMNEGRIRPFAKVHAGLASIGTIFQLQPDTLTWFIEGDKINFGNSPNEESIIEGSNSRIIYSRGADGLNGSRENALNIGIGAGVEVQITERLGLYGDFTYTNYLSDLLDGRRSYNYNPEKNVYKRVETGGNTLKFSVGAVYTIGEGLQLFSGGKTGGKGRSGVNKYRGTKMYPYLPFSPN